MQRKFSSERLGWRGSWEQLFHIIYTGLLSAASKSSHWAMGTFCWPQGDVTLPFLSSDIKGLAERRSPSHGPLTLRLSGTAALLTSGPAKAFVPHCPDEVRSHPTGTQRSPQAADLRGPQASGWTRQRHSPSRPGL